jgi:hypothetical protein
MYNICLQMSKLIRSEFARVSKERRLDIKNAFIERLESLAESEEQVGFNGTRSIPQKSIPQMQIPQKSIPQKSIPQKSISQTGQFPRRSIPQTINLLSSVDKNNSGPLDNT